MSIQKKWVGPAVKQSRIIFITGIISSLLLSYTLTGTAKLGLSVGPGWKFAESLLVPQQNSGSGTKFISVASEETTWNILPILSAKGSYSPTSFMSIRGSIGGSWLRFGEATLFEAQQIGSLIDIATDLARVTLSGNFVAFDGGGSLDFMVRDLVGLHILAGYKVGAASETLSFLQDPTIFFVRSRNLGPYVGLEASLEVAALELAVEYKFLVSMLHIRLTENLSDTRIKRRIHMYGNFFSLELTYHLTEHMHIAQSFNYDEICNHGLGTSRQYAGDIFISSIQNVARVQDKQFSLMTSIVYEF